MREDDAPVPGVEEVVAEREEIAALAAALGELPRSQRDAVILREFYGLSYDEVGAALGVTESAVDSLLVRARRRLHAALRPARVASGVLVVPAALRDSLAEALPGFASSGPGMLARVAALPVAAKLAGAAATVAVVGSIGTVGYRTADIPPLAPRDAKASPNVDAKPAERDSNPVELEPGPSQVSSADVDDNASGDREGDDEQGGEGERDEESGRGDENDREADEPEDEGDADEPEAENSGDSEDSDRPDEPEDD